MRFVTMATRLLYSRNCHGASSEIACNAVHVVRETKQWDLRLELEADVAWTSLVEKAEQNHYQSFDQRCDTSSNKPHLRGQSL